MSMKCNQPELWKDLDNLTSSEFSALEEHSKHCLFHQIILMDDEFCSADLWEKIIPQIEKIKEEDPQTQPQQFPEGVFYKIGRFIYGLIFPEKIYPGHSGYPPWVVSRLVLITIFLSGSIFAASIVLLWNKINETLSSKPEPQPVATIKKRNLSSDSIQNTNDEPVLPSVVTDIQPVPKKSIRPTKETHYSVSAHEFHNGYVDKNETKEEKTENNNKNKDETNYQKTNKDQKKPVSQNIEPAGEGDKKSLGQRYEQTTISSTSSKLEVANLKFQISPMLDIFIEGATPAEMASIRCQVIPKSEYSTKVEEGDLVFTGTPNSIGLCQVPIPPGTNAEFFLVIVYHRDYETRSNLVCASARSIQEKVSRKSKDE